MHATITLYLDSSAEMTRTEFEDLVKVVTSVAELSPVLENIGYVVVED